MNPILNVHLVPEMANPHDLAGHCSVVIDVLRASTSITQALHAGAEAILPCLTVEEARQLAAKRPGSLLGGERGGKPLPGFDLGNSPSEYSPLRVAKKRIIFTTTNGTKAMARCIGSSQVLIGCLVNRAAVCTRLQPHPRVDLICAGTEGAFSMDDALAAGAMVGGLMVEGAATLVMNDAARTVHKLWESCLQPTPAKTLDRIHDVLAHSLGGRNLAELGMLEDIRFASSLDQLDVVPELDRSAWEIRWDH